MALRVEQNYAAGIPQTDLRGGFLPTGLAWHWTAGGTGRAGAESAIRHFINTRLTVNASYHILVFREGATTVAMWIVPVGNASHSMAPSQAFIPKTGDAREAARFAEVRRILGAKAGDPNAGVISISFCGMPADLQAAMADPAFRADMRALASDLIGHPTVIARPHFGHGWIQPTTRYETDATIGGQDILVAQLYEAPIPAPEETMDWYRNIIPSPPARVRLAAQTSYRLSPDLGPGSQPFVLGREDWRVMIGAVKGEDFGAGPDWGVMLSNNGATGEGGIRVFHTQDILETAPLAGTVEVVKEVPTGITQAQLDAAKLNAEDKGARTENERLALAEADRIRNT